MVNTADEELSAYLRQAIGKKVILQTPVSEFEGVLQAEYGGGYRLLYRADGAPQFVSLYFPSELRLEATRPPGRISTARAVSTYSLDGLEGITARLVLWWNDIPTPDSVRPIKS